MDDTNDTAPPEWLSWILELALFAIAVGAVAGRIWWMFA